MAQDEDAIVAAIFDAILEQRLPPGTRLPEAVLCQAFGVGRERARRSLLLLASRDIVELQANRGALVSCPTPAQARDVFEARRTIEPTIVALAIQRAGAADLGRIAAHLDLEASAHADRDRPRAIRLSGRFHVVLAAIAGNHVLERMAGELVARTSLIIGMFGAASTEICRSADHAAILAALRARDARTAQARMLEHLGHIEAGLDLTRRRSAIIDLFALFGAKPR